MVLRRGDTARAKIGEVSRAAKNRVTFMYGSLTLLWTSSYFFLPECLVQSIGVLGQTQYTSTVLLLNFRRHRTPSSSSVTGTRDGNLPPCLFLLSKSSIPRSAVMCGSSDADDHQSWVEGSRVCRDRTKALNRGTTTASLSRFRGVRSVSFVST